MNIFIGNLSYNVTKGDLRQALEALGTELWVSFQIEGVPQAKYSG